MSTSCTSGSRRRSQFSGAVTSPERFAGAAARRSATHLWLACARSSAASAMKGESGRMGA
jgi:hypothetical protein